MRTYLLPLSALLVLTLAAPAQAVDGVLEINQTKALAGGVTPSDTPGFPVTLDQAGSYRLTGNLLVTAGTAILIGADDVTLDLNGFTVSCARAAAICPNTTAPGVDASGQSNVAIFNGTVRAMGGFGIRTGDDARIKMLRVVDNQNTGITVGNRSSVHNCNVSNNGAPTVGSGILVVGSDAIIADNTVSGNANLGISSDFATTVIGNNASTNAGGGISVGPGSTVVNNTATKNGTGGILAEQLAGTDPTNPDSDGDGVPDGEDPTPNQPGVTLAYLANATLDLRLAVKQLDLSNFNGGNFFSNYVKRKFLLRQLALAEKGIVIDRI